MRTSTHAAYAPVACRLVREPGGGSVGDLHRGRIPETARGEEDSLLAILAEWSPGYAPRTAPETLPGDVPKLREWPALRVDHHRTCATVDSHLAQILKIPHVPIGRGGWVSSKGNGGSHSAGHRFGRDWSRPAFLRSSPFPTTVENLKKDRQAPTKKGRQKGRGGRSLRHASCGGLQRRICSGTDLHCCSRCCLLSWSAAAGRQTRDPQGRTS